jgi:hypothetical protein
MPVQSTSDLLPSRKTQCVYGADNRLEEISNIQERAKAPAPEDLRAPQNQVRTWRSESDDALSIVIGDEENVARAIGTVGPAAERMSQPLS